MVEPSGVCVCAISFYITFSLFWLSSISTYITAINWNNNKLFVHVIHIFGILLFFVVRCLRYLFPCAFFLFFDLFDLCGFRISSLECQFGWFFVFLSLCLLCTNILWIAIKNIEQFNDSRIFSSDYIIMMSNDDYYFSPFDCARACIFYVGSVGVYFSFHENETLTLFYLFPLFSKCLFAFKPSDYNCSRCFIHCSHSLSLTRNAGFMSHLLQCHAV